MRDEVTEEMVTIIHDALYPGDREDRMTWPRGIFDVAQALAAAGYRKPHTIPEEAVEAAAPFIAAKALEDAADEYRHYVEPNACIWLRARAATVRGEG